VPPAEARAGATTDDAAAGRSHGIALQTGLGRVIHLGRVAANIFVADPKVIEVRPASATSLFVFGLAPGQTTLAALDGGGRTVALYDVVVQANSFTASQIGGSIDHTLPGVSVGVAPTPNGVSVNGAVSNGSEAEHAIAIARAALPAGQSVDNNLTVNSSATVGLKVRITEMSRQVTRALGVDWSALGTIGKYAIAFATTNGVAPTISSVYNAKGISVDTIIEALASDNLVRILAEPNLTARSGESASFLAGGEYPIPVEQGGTGGNAISITYKQFGVSLSFVPTVLSSGRISLHVRPEVSQIETSAAGGAITLNEGGGTLSIPALTVRRAETTIELGSGQSFAIAGLLQDQTSQTNNFLPGLGEIPILGALFRSDSFQHNQTELVIIVTPYIVGSATDPDALQDAGGGYVPPNDIERVLLLRQIGSGRAAPPVPGDAGFIVR
jgi:pilus assembly protein CpaC